MSTAAATAWLVPLSGPPIEPLTITDVPGGATLGRAETCAVQLPPTADKVSRQHARFVHQTGPAGGAWRVADLDSRWGTTLNGVKLTAGREVPLGEGDLVRITPWTFAFSTRGPTVRGLRSHDDSDLHSTLVRSFGAHDAGGLPTAAPAMGEDLLSLLLECAATLHAAESETALADALIDAAVRGTGLANAAVLRPLDAEGRIQVIAARALSEEASAGYSRTLLNVAAGGAVAELSADSQVDVSQSIVRLGISAAVCAPLMLGGTVAAFLYVDNRGGGRFAAQRPTAAPFCMALARIAGLALANLKRIEIELRQAALEHDLSAAARAQAWILPSRSTVAGPLTCTGESRPGAYVGGDFFDVIVLGDGRVAVALGDVSGHGVAASVLMTAAQGFLHAALKRNEGVAAAVTDLNQFIFPRRPDYCFMTLWVGVFDAAAGQVTYVNAGHGYAMLQDEAGDVTMLDGGEDFPVGFDENAVFGSTTHVLPARGRALVVSDGIVEQFDAGRDGPRTQFGVDGIRGVLGRVAGVEIVAALFDGVFAHAESPGLQDDATAVVVTWT